MTSKPNKTSEGLFDLIEKVALWPGAVRGLRPEAALALAQAGADVGLTSRAQVDLEDLGKLVAATRRKLIIIPG